MSDTIVFDIETKNPTNIAIDINKMEISVVGIYSYKNNSYLTFFEDEFPKLWEYIQNATRLVGYNSDSFDIPILNKYYPEDLTKIKSVDILTTIRESIGRRLRLSCVAEGTIGDTKIAQSKDAPIMWEEKKYEELREYCLKDVELTKKIFDYANKNQKLLYKDLDRVISMQLDIKDWDDSNENIQNGLLQF